MTMAKQPDAIDKYVGSRVRMRRHTLNMTQEALAGQLHLTFQQVQKYEKGTNRISASRLQELSRILQVPVPFFFDGAPRGGGPASAGGTLPASDYVTEFLATADSFTLIRAFTRIRSPQLRRSIVAMVENITVKRKR